MREELPRNDSLPLQDNGTKLTQGELDHKPGGSKKRRPVEGSSEDLCQFPVPDWIGRTHVHGTRNLRMLQQKNESLCKVLDVDPGKPLTAATLSEWPGRMDQAFRHGL